ncbi:unnamed protein product [Microthlaspi erraticum]|uniref:TIR domain-containing protein n=1 Tax=Microthlaspi erraticum TaxID=1685480 RepID=A0A6D2L8R7_9BRAS|nr:unnamed protein product [Microthlaspi erraticum]
MSLMASHSYVPSLNYKFNVLSSFHGPDVRKTLLSHMRDQFKRYGITMFDDQEIERSATIPPSLTEAIRESRISIVILSRRYASSGWCLDELVKIMKCKETMGQIVITIFYGVEPSYVRDQTGDFGIAFNETCARKTGKKRQKWSKALHDVANIAGEDFLIWNNEAAMIEKIAKDVLRKLNATPSRDFDGMVGLEAHLREMESLLDLDCDGVKMVAISGPAGIGKAIMVVLTTMACSCVYKKSFFQSIKQLEALADETTWFGPGSRIVVTTENKDILRQHELARRVTYLCGNLPLGLRVVGSSLRGKNGEEEWEEVIRRLETILDHRDIEQVLRVGYESLHENEQSLFLHIAVFFNGEDGDIVKAMFDDHNNLDIKHGLNILVNRSLIYMYPKGKIVMHKLLQQVGRQAIDRQEPWKRTILTDAQEICDVLEDDKGTRAVSGISFDISRIDEVSIGKKALKKMHNLRFLKVYKRRYDRNYSMHIPEEMEFPSRLRLLQWEAYPSNCLPPTFHPEYLVKLDMKYSLIEYLWQGAQPLTSLKEIDLAWSCQLKELPDPTNATNLETLDLSLCKSLVEIPSSFSRLDKLQKLTVVNCINLQVIPANLNLASLDHVEMFGCSALRNFPVISTHITTLSISKTAVDDLPASTRLCSRLLSLNLEYSIKDLHRLHDLNVSGCKRLESLPELPRSLSVLYANDCESLETVFSPFSTPSAVLCFTNCFKLDQQTQRAMIQRSIIQRPFRYPEEKCLRCLITEPWEIP